MMKYEPVPGIPGEGDVIRYGSVYFRLSVDSTLSNKYWMATALNTGRDGSMVIEEGKRKVVHREYLPHFKYVPVAEG